MFHKKLFAATLLFALAPNALAQGTTTTVPASEGHVYYDTWLGIPWVFTGGQKLICKGGHKHQISYYIRFGQELVTEDKDTGYKCDDVCLTTNGTPIIPIAPAVEVRGEPRNGDGGGPVPEKKSDPCNDQEGASITGGDTGAGSSSGPHPAEEVVRTAAAPYKVTVPFRRFGLPPLYRDFEAATFTLRCNTSAGATTYRVNTRRDVVLREEVCSGAQTAEILVPPFPYQIGVTPDGRWAIVTSVDSSISFIDTSTDKVVKTIRTSGLINPGPLAISPDGSYALVASLTQPVILVVDIARQDVTGTIPLDRSYPTTMRISRDGTLVWVGFPYEQALEVIDIMTGVLSRGIPVTGASSIAFNPTGTLAFISTYGAPGSVLVVDTKTYAIVKTIPAGIGASNMLLSPDTGVLTVNNTTANSITLIDIVSLTSKTVAVGGAPTGGLTVPVE